MENLKALKKENYGRKISVTTEDGFIDFTPKSLRDLNFGNGKKLSYDEYINAQFNSLNNHRKMLEKCFLNNTLGFKGQIFHIENELVCFGRLYVTGYYNNGKVFSGFENHVWVKKKGFEKFKEGDCVYFSGRVYRYCRKDKNTIDYGINRIVSIRKIPGYDFPKEEIEDQRVENIV